MRTSSAARMEVLKTDNGYVLPVRSPVRLVHSSNSPLAPHTRRQSKEQLESMFDQLGDFA